MDKPLSNQECVPCREGAEPLTAEQIKGLLPMIHSAWHVEADKKLMRTIECKNFAEAVEFIQKIADQAESRGHHPDIKLHDFKFITIEWWTHKINGLHHNDFIMASVTDELLPQT